MNLLQREEKSPKGGGIATGYLVSGHGAGEDDAGRVMSGAERGAEGFERIGGGRTAAAGFAVFERCAADISAANTSFSHASTIGSMAVGAAGCGWGESRERSRCRAIGQSKARLPAYSRHVH